MNTRRAISIAFAVLLPLLAVRVQATTYYVSGALGSNTYDGLTNIVVSSSDGPKLNVTNTIAAASSGDTVGVADGFYQELQWDLGDKDLTLNPQGLVIVYGTNPSNTFTLGDGISDGWRQHYFADPTTTNIDSCATCDPDGDTNNNLAEYLAGVDPLDYFSCAGTCLIQPASCFTNQFDTDVLSTISIQPITNSGVFYFGESVTITSAAPIEVYRLAYDRDIVS